MTSLIWELSRSLGFLKDLGGLGTWQVTKISVAVLASIGKSFVGRNPFMGKTVFVTVGTTLFEALVDATTNAMAINWMVDNSYDTLVVQYGKGKRPRIAADLQQKLKSVELYDFKATLEADMRRADLIVSHAGAGTTMEILKFQKRAAVVINSLLMDDHQQELAHAMSSRGHVVAVSGPNELRESTATWDAIETFQPTPFEGGDDSFFPTFLDRFLGLDDKTD